MSHLTGLSGDASVNVGLLDAGPLFEHAARKAGRVGAAAARSAARVRN
jgi:hypothetical protein